MQVKFLWSGNKLDYSPAPNINAVNLAQRMGVKLNNFVAGTYNFQTGEINSYGLGTHPTESELRFMLEWEAYYYERTAASVEDTDPEFNLSFLEDPHTELYPCAWEDKKMRPKCKEALKNHVMNAIHKAGYSDADEWIYFTVFGSGASYNWDEEGDFDVQMWVDIDKYNQLHDTPMTADDLVTAVRAPVQTVNFPTFAELNLATPDCEGKMLIQFYPQPGTGSADENLAKKPYACYDMEKDEWLVEPKPYTSNFYGQHFLAIQSKANDIAIQSEGLIDELQRNTLSWQFWSGMARKYNTTEYEEAAEDAKEKAISQKKGIATLFEGIFGGRQEAYSPEGKGIDDERDATQKLLEVWGIFQKLKHYARAPLPWDTQEMPKEPETKESMWKEAEEENKYAELEGESFGYVNGHLIIGYNHHQAIMAALLKNGWTFEELMGVEQAWGWFDFNFDYSKFNFDSKPGAAKSITVRFASDAGYQNEKVFDDVLAAFTKMFGLPAQRASGGVKSVENSGKEYGQGLAGKNNLNVYLESKGMPEGIITPIPPSPSGNTIPTTGIEIEPEKFAVGDKVQIIGPNFTGTEDWSGKTGVVAELKDGDGDYEVKFPDDPDDYYSEPIDYFPEESLEALSESNHIPGGGKPPPKKNTSTPASKSKLVPGAKFMSNGVPYVIVSGPDEDNEYWVEPSSGGGWSGYLSAADIPLQSVSSLRKFADWNDIMDKSRRLKNNGQVQITVNEPDHVVGTVQGDHDTYQTEIWRDDPSSQAITMWDCECPWSQYSWGRTRQWKKYEGRPCAHTLALFWAAQQQQPQDDTQAPPQAPPVPVPGGGMVQQQGLISPVQLPNQVIPVTGIQPPGGPIQAPTPTPEGNAYSTPTTPENAQGTVTIPGALSHVYSAWKEGNVPKSAQEALDALFQLGGFSLSPDFKPANGQGYFVACPEYEETVSLAEVTVQTILDYKEKCKDFLRQDPTLMIGGWINEGLAYFDLSKAFSDENEALEFARSGNQIAIWDGYNNQEIPVDKISAIVNQMFRQFLHIIVDPELLDEETVTAKTAAFGNGSHVRCKYDVTGEDTVTNQKYVIPQNSAGTVLYSDDTETVVIFPLKGSYHSPHLVKVEGLTYEFYEDTAVNPFIKRRS